MYTTQPPTATGQFKFIHLILARHYVEEDHLTGILRVLEWMKKATYDGDYQFESIELIGRIKVCGGIFGQFGR